MQETLKRLSLLCIALAVLFPPSAMAQQQIGVDIYKSQSASAIKMAIPFPSMAAEVTPDAIREPFYNPLIRDLSFAEIFSIVSLPPNQVNIATAKKAGAQQLLTIAFKLEEAEYVAEVRLTEVGSGTVQLARRYRGSAAALPRIAHTIANDLLIFFNGKPGIFLSQIAFVSNRDGNKEIYLMDYDGSNQRRITFHKSLTISPDWAPDNDRLVYTSFAKGTSDLYIVNRRGGGRIRLTTGVNLNISPTFSPDGQDIAFVGSVNGNPDIYLIRDNGTNLRRLTSNSSIESTPSWSQTGRQLAFTSSRNGTPQIYVMDAEGTNVRRISFDGDWNDDAVWSPAGDELAYTSRVNGRFQIRVMNLSSRQSRIIAGEGSNEQPTWAPDGKSLVFMSNRNGNWQIYRVKADGTDLRLLTSSGINSAPDWSKKPE